MLRSFSPWRLRAIGWVLGVCFVIAIGRLYYLHVIAEPQLQEISQQNRVRLETHPAKRGEITDRNGELIATHQTRFVMGIDPVAYEPSSTPKLSKLAKILDIDMSTLTQATTQTNRRWVKLKEGIDESTYDKIEKLGIKGVYGYPAYDRIYPKQSMAAHVIGFINKEQAAVGGVERLMNFYLKGEDGWRETERDGRRRELGQFRSRDVPSQPGLNVELTLDMRVQAEVEDEINKIVNKFNPDAASIIVSDPKTGFILGMGNYPSFNPNQFWESPLENLRNRAISDVLEPGSTFKVVTVAAALEEGFVTPQTIFDCSEPTVEHNGRTLRLPADHDPLGKLSVRDIVAKSSNRGAAQIGVEIGEDNLYKYASAFGYGQRTGLGLQGESGGILWPVKKWDGLTITRLPMGHAIAATPLQIHCAISALANNGVLMQPQLIRRVYDNNNQTVLEFNPRERRKVVSPSTSQIVREMMVKVVGPEGTARNAYIEGYEVAGKTGTTQKIIDGRYSRHQHVASFSGFFPARNPKLAITVIVDTPRNRGIGYGGVVCAPAFKDIASRLIQHLAIAPVAPITAVAGR